MQRVLDVAVGVLTEVLHPNVAGRVVDHEIRGDGRNVDLVAHQFELDHLGVAAASHTDADGGPLRAAQLAHRLIDGPPFGVLPLDVGHHVAPPDAFLVGGGLFEHLHRGDVAVDRLNRHADSVVTAFLPLAHLRVFFRAEEARMRIERAEHAAHRAVHQIVGVDLVDVIGLDRIQRRGERAVVFGNLIVGRKRAASEQPADQGGDQDREEHGGQGSVTSHDRDRNR